MSLSERFCSERKRRGLSLRGFGEVLGVTREHIWRIERGERGMDLQRVEAWAQVLGIPPQVLIADVLQFCARRDLEKAGLAYEVTVVVVTPSKK